MSLPTIFCRDEINGLVTGRWSEDCAWVMAGEGVATVKLDGARMRMWAGTMYRRGVPGTPSWIPCYRDSKEPADIIAFEAFDRLVSDKFLPPDGEYVLVGPLVKGNPHGMTVHELVNTVPVLDKLVLQGFDERLRMFSNLKSVLSDPKFSWEGIVFHHPDGRLCQIVKTDFGLKWPPVKH